MSNIFEFVEDNPNQPRRDRPCLRRYVIARDSQGRPTIQISFRALPEDLVLGGVTFKKGDLDPRDKASMAVLQFQRPDPSGPDGMRWILTRELAHDQSHFWDPATKSFGGPRIGSLALGGPSLVDGNQRYIDPGSVLYQTLNKLCCVSDWVGGEPESTTSPQEQRREAEADLESLPC